MRWIPHIEFDPFAVLTVLVLSVVASMAILFIDCGGNWKHFRALTGDSPYSAKEQGK